MADAAAKADGIAVGEDGLARCWWADSAPEYRAYHDSEWGFPVADDRRLFEKLSLEGFQAGLSWLTILRKREAFRDAFDGFDPAKVAVRREGRQPAARKRLDSPPPRQDRGGHQQRRSDVELQDAEGSIARFVWGFEPGPRPAGVRWGEVVSTTARVVSLSPAMEL